jgi:hypothetical protein
MPLLNSRGISHGRLTIMCGVEYIPLPNYSWSSHGTVSITTTTQEMLLLKYRLYRFHLPTVLTPWIMNTTESRWTH